MDSSLAKSEEDLDTVALTQSFWDIKNYRKVVRRIDDGYKVSTDMMKMVHERMDAESRYIKHLQQWSKKWDDYISKSSEYGTLENGWKALFLSTSRVAEVHASCQKKLDELLKNLTEWRNDHYHKSIGGKLKESKKAEEGFQKAQKPWEKHFDRTNKAKKSYHQVAKELDLAEMALRNGEENPAENTQEQITKLRERKEKAEKEKEKGRRKYKELLDDLFHHKRHYIEDMEREFDKCQAFEKTRIEFFKESLLRLKAIVDLSKDNQISCIYQVCTHALNQIDSEEDLQWYSLHYGAGMPYVWPEFEEYAPSTSASQNNLHLKADIECSSSVDSRSPRMSNEIYPENHIYESADVWQEPPPVIPYSSRTETISPSNSLSFGERTVTSDEMKEEDVCEDGGETNEDTEGEGELLKALYDYVGEDDDDLSFFVGDIIRVVEYCDGGWAKAFLRDQYGYVPSSYFERIHSTTTD